MGFKVSKIDGRKLTSTQIPVVALPSWWAANKAATVSVVLSPALSDKMRGKVSKACANLWMAYWSNPGHLSANWLICLASSTSTAPAPGTSRPSLDKTLKLLIPSSIARSMSSRKLSVAPRTIMVAMRDSFSS